MLEPGVLLGVMVFGAAIGALVGQRKGRVGAGVAFGALVGPLGWLLVALGPDRRPKCAECGGVVAAGARKCMHCGAPVGFDAAAYEQRKAAMAAPRVVADPTIACPHCAAPIAVRGLQPGGNTCASCGGTFAVEA